MSLQTRQSGLNNNSRKPHAHLKIRSYYGYKLLWIQLNDTQLSSLDLPCRSNNYSFLLTLLFVISVSQLTVGLLFAWYP